MNHISLANTCASHKIGTADNDLSATKYILFRSVVFITNFRGIFWPKDGKMRKFFGQSSICEFNILQFFFTVALQHFKESLASYVK